MFFLGKPSKTAFGKQLMKAMHKLTGGKYRFEIEPFEILRLDHKAQLFLGNIYAEHCQLPRSQRSRNIQRLAASLVASDNDIPTEYEAAKANLRPKVWSRMMIDSTNYKSQFEGKKSMSLRCEPLGDHLYLSLVFDTTDTMRSLGDDQFDIWGVSFEEAFEDACVNLRASTIAYSAIGDHVICSISGDNYDSSRIVLLDKIRQKEFTGQPIAIVPDRDNLYVADSDDPKAIEIIFTLAEKYSAEVARPLSPLPLIFEDGVWLQWEPPQEHPIRPTFEKIRLQFLGSLYQDQQELLNQLNSTNSKAPFVATYSAVQKKDSDEVFSYSVWVKGLNMLLPAADLIMFADENGVLGSYAWSDVQRVCGALIEPEPGLYPERFLATGFPSDDQFAEMTSVL